MSSLNYAGNPIIFTYCSLCCLLYSFIAAINLKRGVKFFNQHLANKPNSQTIHIQYKLLIIMFHFIFMKMLLLPLGFSCGVVMVVGSDTKVQSSKRQVDRDNLKWPNY